VGLHYCQTISWQNPENRFSLYELASGPRTLLCGFWVETHEFDFSAKTKEKRVIQALTHHETYNT